MQTSPAVVDPVLREPPEIVVVTTHRVSCDGSGPSGGHPRVFLQIGEEGFVECGYCDRRFVLDPDADEGPH